MVETALNIAYVYLAHVSSWPGAPVIGLISATMTLSKTVLYFFQEYYCGWCAVGHNPWGSLILYWIFPNGYVFLSSLGPCVIACADESRFVSSHLRLFVLCLDLVYRAIRGVDPGIGFGSRSRP